MLNQILFLGFLVGVGHGGTTVPFEPDPIFETIDLNATYFAMKKIFARMRLSPKEMAALIGGGHSSGKGSLEGGTYHGNWVSPKAQFGNAYFQLLTGHKQWCAVKSSDNGNAHFVAKGAADYIAETEYSPLRKYNGTIPCIETGPNRAVFDVLPTVPADELSFQPGIWHASSGSTAMLPVDFALQYADETYVHVVSWALNGRLFFTDFQAAWTKMAENGQQLRCPNVNGPAEFAYSDECADRFGVEAAYRKTWTSIRSNIKGLLESLPPRCNSTRPAAPQLPGTPGSVCPSSILRLGFHISATYDPDSDGNVGGSNFANFLEPCAIFDGCAGCLKDTQLSLQRIQQRYQHAHVSLADVTLYAAGLSAAFLAEFQLNHMPFHPGRVDHKIVDEATCKELGARLPSPAYQWKSSPGGADGKPMEGMLSGDLLLPPVSSAAVHVQDEPLLV